MKYKYGEFSVEQIAETKKKLRKRIFFLLLYADPEKTEEYKCVSVDDAIESVLCAIGGFNELLGFPEELVEVSCLLNAALIEHKKTDFNFAKYRKLILDAGNKVLKIREV